MGSDHGPRLSQGGIPRCRPRRLESAVLPQCGGRIGGMTTSARNRVRVRGFAEGDRDVVVALWARVFGEGAPRNAPGPMLDRKLAQGDGLVWVAEDRPGGAIVGAVAAGYDGVRGWIYHLAVDEAHRRRGIASALLRAAEAELVRRGCPKVNLQVMGSNAAVVALYEAAGYAVEDRISMGRVLDDGRRPPANS